MDEREIYEMLSRDPKTQEEAVLQAYQLGRLLGRTEAMGRPAGIEYDALCEFVADKTAALTSIRS